MSLGIIKKDKTAFIMIDIQERFLPVIHEIYDVIENSNRLVKGTSILDIPLLVTEQYPKGLGPTVNNIELDDNQKIIEKISFGCFGCIDFVDEINKINVDSLVIFGIESHVCVLKTSLEALDRGYEVHVIADATSSRTLDNKHIALERLRQSGAFIASTEMILFLLMEKSGSDEFKAISKLVK
ncbi:isochorismatase family protein [Candidatus Poribacteria bacterium]|nr:isochorismatase family protein [Candidatus Poribacteria bacterium]